MVCRLENIKVLQVQLFGGQQFNVNALPRSTEATLSNLCKPSCLWYIQLVF